MAITVTVGIVFKNQLRPNVVKCVSYRIGQTLFGRMYRFTAEDFQRPKDCTTGIDRPFNAAEVAAPMRKLWPLKPNVGTPNASRPFFRMCRNWYAVRGDPSACTNSGHSCEFGLRRKCNDIEFPCWSVLENRSLIIMVDWSWPSNLRSESPRIREQSADLLEAVISPTRKNPKKANRKAERNKAASCSDLTMQATMWQSLPNKSNVTGRLMSDLRLLLRQPSLSF